MNINGPIKLAAFGTLLLLLMSGQIFAEEKNMTPLSGKEIPMIEGIKMLEVGAIAPAFEVRDLNGETFSFTEKARKKGHLLVFWSIFCEPCRFEMPLIQSLHNKYSGDNFDVIAIAIDGEPLKNAISGFVKQEGFSFHVLIDELDEEEYFKVADPYGVAGTPTIYLVGKDGKIAFAKAGRITEKELDREIKVVIKK